VIAIAAAESGRLSVGCPNSRRNTTVYLINCKRFSFSIEFFSRDAALSFLRHFARHYGQVAIRHRSIAIRA
jgi:hypothetical protein